MEAQSHGNQERRNVSNFGKGGGGSHKRTTFDQVFPFVPDKTIFERANWPTSPWVPTPLIATRLVTRSRDVSTYAQNLPMKVLLTLILYNISMTAVTLIGEKEVL